MDFLFVHGNYPAQFLHLAPLLGQSKNNRVVFLTAREDEITERLSGVEIRLFSTHRNPHPETHHYLTATEEAVLRGQAVLRELDQMVKSGFRPQVVVSHGGMGLGLFIKDLLPETLHIGYFEWYFRNETTRNLLETFDFDDQLRTGLRNLPILQELEQCDLGIVPTEWQKSQFPKTYQQKLEVIFDGVDTNFFHPHEDSSSLQKQDLTIHNRETGQRFTMEAEKTVLSYATRGMEPIRGFPEFMRALPRLLANNPTMQVFIAGADRRAYSYDAPSHGGSWKNHLLEELGNFSGRERIFFTGLLNYNDYRLLLWRSNLHCYLTRPYVTSWSLFEAAACAARLAVNKSPATKNIIDEKTVTWINLDNNENLSQTLQEALNNDEGPRSRIIKGFELSESLKKWVHLLNTALQGKN